MGVINSALVTHQTNSGSLSGTYALQTGSGEDRMLAITLTTGDTQGDEEYAAFPNYVRFDGVDATQADTVMIDEPDYNAASCFVYYILEADLPSSAGTYNVEVEWSDTWVDAASCAVVELDDVDQEDPISGTQSAVSFGTSTSEGPGDPGDVLISCIHVNGENTAISAMVSNTSDAVVIYTVSEGGSGEDYFDKEQASGAAYDVGADTVGWSVSQDAQNEAHLVVGVNYISPGSDTTPESFNLTEETDAVPGNTYISNSVTVSGVNAPTPVNISGHSSAQYRINEGPWRTSTNDVNNGGSVEVRMDAPSSFSSSNDCTLDIGGVTDIFTISTSSEDTTPDQFTFNDQTDVLPDDTVVSNEITVTGINSPSPITISGESGSEYRVNQGAWTTETVAPSFYSRDYIQITGLTNAGTDNDDTFSGTWNTVDLNTHDPDGVPDDATGVLFLVRDSGPDKVKGTRIVGETAVFNGGGTGFNNLDYMWCPLDATDNNKVELYTEDNTKPFVLLGYTGGSFHFFSADAGFPTTTGSSIGTHSPPTEAAGAEALLTVPNEAFRWQFSSSGSITAQTSTGGMFPLNSSGEYYGTSGITVCGYVDGGVTNLGQNPSSSLTHDGTTQTFPDTFSGESLVLIEYAVDLGEELVFFTGGTSSTYIIQEDTTASSGFRVQMLVPLGSSGAVDYKGDADGPDSNGGVWTQATLGDVGVVDTVDNEDGVEVRLPTSSQLDDTTSATLDIGGVTDTFSATTVDTEPDTTPDSFSFSDQTGVPLDTTVVSDQITITGINATTPISISGESGSEYRINGGSWRTEEHTVQENDQVEVQLPTADSFDTETSATLDVGGVTDTFAATTTEADSTPDQFNFVDQTDVETGELIESNQITVAGINTTASISISGAGGSEYRINNGLWTSSSGSVQSGEVVDVRVPSSATYEATTSATLDIGGVTDTFSVTTMEEPSDTTPDQFAFLDEVDVERNIEVVSNEITVTGISDPADISIFGEDGAAYSVNGGEWQTGSSSVNNNDGVRVRLPTSESFSSSTECTLDIGGVTDTFSAITEDAPTGATPITAADGDTDVVIGQDPGFTGSVESIVLRTSDRSFEQELSFGDSHTDSDPTFDMPDFSNIGFETDWVPWDTSSYSLRIEVESDDPSDEPYVALLNREMPGDYAVTEVAAVRRTRESLFYGVEEPLTTPPPGSQVVYSEEDNTSISSEGIISTDVSGDFLNVWVWRPDTGKVEFEQVFIPGGVNIFIDPEPSTLEPDTEYVATVENATGIIESGRTYNGDVSYSVSIEHAAFTSVTFTTSSNLPPGSPVDFSFTLRVL